MIKNIKQLHAFVRKREHNTCQGCGRLFSDNECCAHHIKSQGSRPDLKLDPDNCRLLCAYCHHATHLGISVCAKIALTDLEN